MNTGEDDHDDIHHIHDFVLIYLRVSNRHANLHHWKVSMEDNQVLLKEVKFELSLKKDIHQACESGSDQFSAQDFNHN